MQLLAKFEKNSVSDWAASDTMIVESIDKEW